MKMARNMVIGLLFLLAAEAHAKNSCEISATPAAPLEFQRSSLIDRLTNRWRGRDVIQQRVDLTGKLDNSALNRVDMIDIEFHSGSGQEPVVKRFAADRLFIRDGEIIELQPRLDRVLSAVNSPKIKSIQGLRVANSARDEFESFPILQGEKINEGDHVSLHLHRSLPRDPEFRLRLIPDGAYLTGQVLRLTLGRDDVHVLLVDRHRRLYQIPLKSVAEFRQPVVTQTHPNHDAEETFRAFGQTWGNAQRNLRTLEGDHATNALRLYRGRTNAVILVKGMLRIGTAVIAINPVDRQDIIFGRDTMRLPWLDLDIPYSSVERYADDNTN